MMQTIVVAKITLVAKAVLNTKAKKLNKNPYQDKELGAMALPPRI